MNIYVDIFFRLLNFAVLIAAAIYCFKKYVAPSLQMQLASHDAHEEQLLSHQSVLESEHVQIDNCITHEEQLCDQLHEKVTKWSTVIEKRLQDRQVHKKEVMQQLFVQQQEQYAQTAQQKVLDEVVSSAVAQSKKELIARFKDENEHKKFIASVVQFMREHSS